MKSSVIENILMALEITPGPLFLKIEAVAEQRDV